MEDVDFNIPKHSSSAAAFIKNRYYVYALFKRQDANPFYVGKGINSRVNQHFMKSSLAEGDSRKNKTIRKYGDSIRREILCYFDKESSAFEFEEYLIRLYGLVDEGGCLYNVAKSRHEFPESSKKIISKKKTDRTIVYSEDEIVRVYKNYFERRMNILSSVEGTSVPPRYASAILRGERFKGLYARYVESGKVVNLRTPDDNILRKAPENQKVSDKNLIEAFEMVCQGNITTRAICKELGVSQEWLGCVFLGKSRPYLKLDSERYRSLPKGRKVGQDLSYTRFTKVYPEIVDTKELVGLVGKSASRICAYKRRYKQEKEDQDVPRSMAS